MDFKIALHGFKPRIGFYELIVRRGAELIRRRGPCIFRLLLDLPAGGGDFSGEALGWALGGGDAAGGHWRPGQG